MAAERKLELTIAAAKAHKTETALKLTAGTAARESTQAQKTADAKAREAADAARAAEKTSGTAKPAAEAKAKRLRAEANTTSEQARVAQERARKAETDARAATKATEIKAAAAGIGIAPLEKPPFSATPQGQKLTPGANVTDNIKIAQTPADSARARQATPEVMVVRTPGNPQYGLAGDVRNDGTKRHAGIDESGNTTRFTGLYKGKVTFADPNFKNLGGYVIVTFEAPDGTKWEQRSMHLQTLNVESGQTIDPSQVIGEGMGKGAIFSGGEPPHVHSEFRRNGRPVEPYSGRELEFNPVADVKERQSTAKQAAEAAEAARKKAERAKAAADGSDK